MCEPSDLPSDVIKCELYRILENHGYKNSTLSITSASGKGDNYMGCIYRIKAALDEKPFTTLCLICKIEPLNPTTRLELRTGVAFERECVLYDELFPLYQSFQSWKRIPEALRFYHHPKCYRTGQGFLFLNDLVADGYRMHDRFKNLDYEHVSKAMEAFGRFHAVGFALKDQRPDLFDGYKRLKDHLFSHPLNEGLYSYVHVMFDQAIESLTEEDAEVRTKMRFIQKNLKKIIPVLLMSEEAEPYAVITHGDCWNNNMMFKYENGTVANACLLDFQMCRYASPALDLAYFIFCCTDKEFRDSHYDQILHVYHRSLARLLARLGSDVSSVFPYEQLEEQMRRFGCYGLVMATILLKIAGAEADEIPETDEVAEKIKNDVDFAKKMSFGSDMRVYRARIRDLIRDVDRYGMLSFDSITFENI